MLSLPTCPDDRALRRHIHSFPPQYPPSNTNVFERDTQPDRLFHILDLPVDAYLHDSEDNKITILRERASGESDYLSFDSRRQQEVDHDPTYAGQTHLCKGGFRRALAMIISFTLKVHQFNPLRWGILWRERMDVPSQCTIVRAGR
jgi:hypothetical protein